QGNRLARIINVKVEETPSGVNAMSKYPRCGVDASGLWREDWPGSRVTLAWQEVAQVRACKLDCVTAVVTVLQIDHPSGDCLEFDSDAAGFDEVVAALTRELPGISPDWYAQVASLDQDDASIVVWRRLALGKNA